MAAFFRWLRPPRDLSSTYPEDTPPEDRLCVLASEKNRVIRETQKVKSIAKPISMFPANNGIFKGDSVNPRAKSG
jgi:hypothetical protein